MSATLVIQFKGWCIIRLATDPDPPDEPRGVSGYTFAFAGEPDLDRIVRMQPPRAYKPRSHGPKKLGVFVTEAKRIDDKSTVMIPGLKDAKVNLLGEPRLENRNWTLTLPGYEPIHPFNLSISKASIRIRRSAPFDPKHPNLPIWKVPQDKLLAHGANGMESEPETIGRATGIWDPLLLVTARKGLLEKDLAAETNPVAKAALQGRIAELAIGIKNMQLTGSDRRVTARNFIERFGFTMEGANPQIRDPGNALKGKLSATKPWQINFWLGAWDPDLLCAYMEGSLRIPYRPLSKARARRASKGSAKRGQSSVARKRGPKSSASRRRPRSGPRQRAPARSK
jgi:hypothetical protein